MIMCSSQTMKFELANFIGQTLDQKDFFMVEKGHQLVLQMQVMLEFADFIQIMIIDYFMFNQTMMMIMPNYLLQTFLL